MFQVPPAVLRPTSKAQFHRAAEAMLRMIAADLNLNSAQVSIESSAGLTSTMGSVCMDTPALRLEVFMDNFSRAEAPRLMFRDRFNASTTRHKWISDLDLSSRTDVIVELRNLSRAARPLAETAPARTSAFSRLAAWLA